MHLALIAGLYRWKVKNLVFSAKAKVFRKLNLTMLKQSIYRLSSRTFLISQEYHIITTRTLLEW